MARNSCPSILYVIGVSGPGKTNLLLNLINNEPDVDKMYLFAKDIYNAKYHLLINKTKYGSKAFIEYSNEMDDIYKNIEKYSPNKKRKILIVFDDIIADMLSNKRLNPIVTELFIRGRKLNICLVFILHDLILVFQKISN